MTVAVGGYRESSTLTANESSFNFATKHNGSYVYFVSKDNDTNSEKDADYFTMVGIG
jgi:hypothetical protein